MMDPFLRNSGETIQYSFGFLNIMLGLCGDWVSFSPEICGFLFILIDLVLCLAGTCLLPGYSITTPVLECWVSNDGK